MSNAAFSWVAVFLVSASCAYGQETMIEGDTLGRSNPSIYIDCLACDLDFFRNEMTFVNYVRDRKLADVYILVSERSTGSGGTEYTVWFTGQRRFGGLDDSLQYVANEFDTEDSVRSGLANTLKVGLVRYVAKTPVGRQISVEYSLPSEPQKIIDKWRNWVFEIWVESLLEGETSSHGVNIYADISARRVTKDMKITLGIWGNYYRCRYAYGDYRAVNLARSGGADTHMYWSLGNHWSVGHWAAGSSSIYGNKKIELSNAPGIEYDPFPYSQSARRILTFTYRIGLSYVNYEETTIFDRTREWLTWERLTVALGLIQPWGTVKASLRGSHYFHDFEKNRLELYSQFRLRLFKGVSVDISAKVLRIHDQLALRKGGASQEEVLLRRRELATSYSYYTSFGISYTFGSIYNNIVNPRFGD